MNTYALVSDNRVVNVIVLEEGAEWSPPDGHELVLVDGTIGIGSFRQPDGTFHTPSAPVPVSISAAQARKALNRLGYRDAVEAYVATLSRDEQDDWEYATSIHRDNPIIAAGAAALGLSAEQVDDLFRMGATL